ncbi:hypothetical protein F506_17780 [Herbaspirillum hiltneri N3]|uniref:Uncharacterized protein n=2 Tax=Herbaspirillum TaxID=963 RepID=A0ABM5V459_9BURK|nr:hypothetical protein F506_17780 [Herbaspirillum hiltneri N3]
MLPEFELPNDTLPGGAARRTGWLAGQGVVLPPSLDARRACSATLASMLKKILFILRLAIVFAGIVLFGRAVQYLILNGGFNGSFYDIIFFRS